MGRVLSAGIGTLALTWGALDTAVLVADAIAEPDTVNVTITRIDHSCFRCLDSEIHTADGRAYSTVIGWLLLWQSVPSKARLSVGQYGGRVLWLEAQP